MKLLTPITFALSLAAAGALAEQHATEDGTADAPEASETPRSLHDKAMRSDMIHAGALTGSDIYTTGTRDAESWDPQTVRNNVGSGWTRIGTVQDIVMDRSGKMTGIVTEVGGFLDVADKHVMIPVEDLNLVTKDMSEFSFVTRMDQDALEAMEGLDDTLWN